MIRQLCPHCLAAVELPPDAPGSVVPCPRCTKPIPVPAGYVPAVAPESRLPPEPPPVPADPTDLPPPPPGFVPPRMTAAASDPRPVAVGPAGPAPAWLGWLPAAALALALVLTFLPWVGSFPGGVRVYTQTPWQAAVGTFATAILPDGLTDDEGPLRAAVRSNAWLWLYLPALLAAVALAWAERLVHDPTALPGRAAALARVWPHRFALLAGLAALALLPLLLQNWHGFGLETAARRVAADKYADERAAAGDNTNKQTVAAVKAGREVNRIGVQGATALDLAVLLHLLAAGGAAARWWADRRGDRPLPRLVLVRG